MKRHDSDDSPVAAKLQGFDLLKKTLINVHIIIIKEMSAAYLQLQILCQAVQINLCAAKRRVGVKRRSVFCYCPEAFEPVNAIQFISIYSSGIHQYTK